MISEAYLVCEIVVDQRRILCLILVDRMSGFLADKLVLRVDSVPMRRLPSWCRYKESSAGANWHVRIAL